MKGKKLTVRFFARPTLTVARELLGKYLVVKRGRDVRAGKIVETEAYIGEDDKACHASKGRTKRTETLYAKPGTVYVYLIYGMYHCLNIVTEKKDFPSAVLIRALEPAEGIAAHPRVTSGPGKLCRALGVTRHMNGVSVSDAALWVEDRGERVGKGDIVESARIGVEYAKQSRHYPWRFYLRNSAFVSRR